VSNRRRFTVEPHAVAQFPGVINATVLAWNAVCRFCEGFRVTASTDDGAGTKAVVRKPPKKENAVACRFEEVRPNLEHQGYVRADCQANRAPQTRPRLTNGRGASGRASCATRRTSRIPSRSMSSYAGRAASTPAAGSQGLGDLAAKRF
jgi:hypothetical protein